MPFEQVIHDEIGLRALYREPGEPTRKKKVAQLNEQTRRFIGVAPFCLIATADTEGRCDVSPRGGPPGFVRVLDEHRLAVPDLSGNNLLDSLTNIVANPHVGMLFVMPGRDETLRVEGHASLTTDPAVLALWDDELRRPKLAIGVVVTQAFIHCAKSFRRGRVWDVASWDELDAPDVCDITVDNLGIEIDPAIIRNALEENYSHDLNEEKA